VLGYFPPPDRLFEENNIESTIWGIEQIRNQEFGEYQFKNHRTGNR
jgi:hypothetical protein